MDFRGTALQHFLLLSNSLHGLSMDSMWSLWGVYGDSTGTPHGLAEIHGLHGLYPWTPHGLPADSSWTLCRLHESLVQLKIIKLIIIINEKVVMAGVELQTFQSQYNGMPTS